MSHVHFCGCGTTRYFELLLQQADEKGDMNQIWPVSKPRYMAVGDHWQNGREHAMAEIIFS